MHIIRQIKCFSSATNTRNHIKVAYVHNILFVGYHTIFFSFVKVSTSVSKYYDKDSTLIGSRKSMSCHRKL